MQPLELQGCIADQGPIAGLRVHSVAVLLGILSLLELPPFPLQLFYRVLEKFDPPCPVSLSNSPHLDPPFLKTFDKTNQKQAFYCEVGAHNNCQKCIRLLENGLKGANLTERRV